MHQALREKWMERAEGKGRDEGAWKETPEGRRKSNHAAWDKSFVALSDSQSTNWCLLEPGYAGECRRERAREERSREWASPAARGLHFAVIICTNSVKETGRKSAEGSPPDPRDPGPGYPSRGPGAYSTEPQELTFIIDLAVPVDVGLSDHLIHFLIGQLLAQVRHDVTQLCSADVAVAILGVGG